MTQRFILQPYRYANGVRYRPNLFYIKPFDEELGHAAIRPSGGLIVLGDKVLAFAGRHVAALLQSPVAVVMRDADHYVWGASRSEAKMKIKPYLTVY